MECVVCHGKGCDLCDHGSVIESGCPQKEVGPVISTLTMIDMSEKGHLPVTGGVLDQSQWFIEAYKFYTADIATIKAES
jgi:hypothetical protein